ncbi:hypothetical protein PPUJ21368_44340 [Pseudomonas putida]|nr:hypothetical protein PPUJ21368_44340 [Pseudomonas putida]
MAKGVDRRVAQADQGQLVFAAIVDELHGVTFLLVGRGRSADPVAAGSPANTGEAGAMHRGVFFAGKPAPTG